MAKQINADAAKFIRESGAEEVLQKLRAHFEGSGRPPRFSDVEDTQGHQYVDLVQEGGGVWGVALLGYTYILEKMGIRFFSLAGTSAGAINTMMLAATGRKSEEKTEKIVKDFLELDLFDLVDGKRSNGSLTRWVKKIIQKFVLRKNYVKRLKFYSILLLALVAATSIASFITGLAWWLSVARWLFIGGLLSWGVLVSLVVFLQMKIKTLSRTGYGLNEGSFFRNWIKERLEEKGISNLEDLKRVFATYPGDLVVHEDRSRDMMMTITSQKPVQPPNEPVLTLIVSDITTGNKIEFPRMWDLYWKQITDVPPADFVRASMSIPVFYETFKLRVLNKDPEKWKVHINWTGDIPDEVQFIDGGILSNFPISIFFNPTFIIPRMPTFGVRLGDGTEEQLNQINSLGSFASSILSTLTSNTDKDFINRNKAFSLGITHVNLKEYSWLNFFMNDKQKQEMFKKGAEAAAEFLKYFNWEKYKTERLNNYDILLEQRNNPNNW